MTWNPHQESRLLKLRQQVRDLEEARSDAFTEVRGLTENLTAKVKSGMTSSEMAEWLTENVSEIREVLRPFDLNEVMPEATKEKA